jgi:serine O-acetyltransferase
VPADDRTLWQIMKEDRIPYYARMPGPWGQPGYYVLAIHRWGALRAARRGRFPLLNRPLSAVLKVLRFLTRAVYGIEIDPYTEIGRRLLIAHQGGIVLGAERIGDDCIIRQNVTIGRAAVGGGRPIVGDRVDIGAGAVIIGAVTIGHDTKIGPNAVITRSVPPDSLVVAPPARIMRRPRRT